MHIPSMEEFSVAGILLLVISGTLVGIMFSLITYKGNSISNSSLLHAVWNFVFVTDMIHITTAQGIYGEPVFSIIIPSDHVLVTGAGFGVEASIIAIIGVFICLRSRYSTEKAMSIASSLFGNFSLEEMYELVKTHSGPR